MIASKRRENRLPRGKDKRFKLELLNELIQDAGGRTEVTATRRLQAEIVATVNIVIAKPVISARALPVGAGRGIGWALRELPGGSTFGKPNSFRDTDDEPPAKESYSYRFWGE